MTSKVGLITAVLLSGLGLTACQGAGTRLATPSRSDFLSEAIATQALVFLSGQLGMDPKTGTLAEGGIEAQTRQALENLRAAAERAGVALADAARVEVYLVDMNDYARMNAIYTAYFPSPAPARTCVGVAALPRGGMVEVAATIVRR